ncbi:MAG: hypothetical protein IKB97_10040 [Bacteroidaceae bacterium]|nr:hypothetical protein [Bacteroidaceae bacterium]
MNKFILSIFLLGCVATGSAQSFDYITFRTADGTEKSMAIDGLKLTFAEGKMTASNTVETLSYDLATLGCMYFAAEPTAVTALPVNETAVQVKNGGLYVAAPAGTQVLLYAIDGRILGAFTKQNSDVELLGNRLTPGTYIVKVGGCSYKLLAR